MSEGLNSLQATWEGWAQADPLWAILSDPAKAGGRWSVEEFFATGDREIAIVDQMLSSVGLTIPRAARAFDFGCGIGRLSRALGRRAGRCTGVDISQTMIEQAKRLNAEEPCDFVCSSEQRIPFDDGEFDFVYSSVVLQHIPRPYQDGYVRELLRILAPTGLAVFQTFDSDLGPPPVDAKQRWQTLKSKIAIRTRIKQAAEVVGLSRKAALPPAPAAYSMNSLPENEVRAIILSAGAELLEVKLTNSTSADFNGNLSFLTEQPAHGLLSKLYVVKKNP